jgi:hypothetical protein
MVMCLTQQGDGCNVFGNSYDSSRVHYKCCFFDRLGELSMVNERITKPTKKSINGWSRIGQIRRLEQIIRLCCFTQLTESSLFDANTKNRCPDGWPG